MINDINQLIASRSLSRPDLHVRRDANREYVLRHTTKPDSAPTCRTDGAMRI